MRTLGLKLALVLLAGPSCTSVTQPVSADICADPAVSAMAKGECHAQNVLFRTGGKIGTAQLATVATGYVRDYDVMYPTLRYFLRDPRDRLIDLGTFPPARGLATLELYRQLGYRLENAGGLARTNPSDFYDRLIDRNDGKYCMVYRMKHPLIGELKDCDGTPKPTGSVSYAPGVVTWLEAGERICLLSNQFPADACYEGRGGVITNAIRRDAGGRMYYFIVARYMLRSYPDSKIDRGGTINIPSEWDYSTYQVDAVTGKIDLEKQETMYCDGRTCIPIEKGKN